MPINCHGVVTVLRKSLLAAVCMLLLSAGGVQAGTSNTAYTADLNMGGNFTTPIYLIQTDTDNLGKTTTTYLSEGGGSIDTSYLNSSKLAYLYCVDMSTIVYVPSDYPNSLVTNNATIYGGSSNAKQVNNAASVAWLLTNYGTGGQGDKAYALQAAIWHEIYPDITLDTNKSSQSQVILYNAYLKALGTNTGSVGNFLWITPANSSGQYQAQVGAVPVPAAVWLLASGLIGLVGIRRRFTK